MTQQLLTTQFLQHLTWVSNMTAATDIMASSTISNRDWIFEARMLEQCERYEDMVEVMMDHIQQLPVRNVHVGWLALRWFQTNDPPHFCFGRTQRNWMSKPAICSVLVSRTSSDLNASPFALFPPSAKSKAGCSTEILQLSTPSKRRLMEIEKRRRDVYLARQLPSRSD